MNIKTIEEAKKYIGKIVYTAYNLNQENSNSLNKVETLYIGGVHLFYNQVNYEIIGLELYENTKCTKGWGNINLNRIVDKFDKNKGYNYYFFSKEEAEKYCIWMNNSEKERNRENDVKRAKELLKEHKIKFEIFD